MDSNFLQTNLSSSETPIMITDNRGYAHCLWKKGSIYYTKFNGTNWEFLDDSKIIPITTSAFLPTNAMVLNLDNYPYILYVTTSLRNPWGNNCNVYLEYWDGTEWNLENSTIYSQLYGASLVFYNNVLYIGTLVKSSNLYWLNIYSYSGGFNLLSSKQVTQFKGSIENKLLMKVVYDEICCFWNNADTTNYWIEHVIYYPATNLFEATSDRKVDFSNSTVPIGGFDFAYFV